MKPVLLERRHGMKRRALHFALQMTCHARTAGLMPSFGSVGDAFDNAMLESFWSSMRNELRDRQRWTTRVELSNPMFEYIEVFYNRRRRHSQLGYASPSEYERTLTQETA